jgi:hypothetical protein
MAFGDWIALISPVVAVFVAFFGFQRSTRSDQLAAFFQLQERYLAPEVRTGRRLVFAHVAGRSEAEIAKLPDDVRSAIGYALAVMNSIAIACEAHYVDPTVVARSMGRSYLSCMTAAQPFIDHVEKIRGFRPYGYAERMATMIGTMPALGPGTQGERESVSPG